MDDDFLSMLRVKKTLNVTYPLHKEIKYFYLKKNDKYTYFKERILNNKLNFEEMTNGCEIKPVNFLSKKSFFTYGIIIITQEKEIFLFNNTDSSNDLLIKLNLDFLERYSIFNSQLVLIRGKNVSNNEILVEGINCMPVLDVNKSETNNNYKINIFNNLININLDKPDILIFIGCENITEMKNIIKSLESTVFIHIPIIEQLDNINIFPQPSSKYEIENLKTLTNPSSFFIDDKLFCINTLPVIDELINQEIFRNDSSPKDDLCGEILFEEDVVNRLCYHLIFQKSYLPIISNNYNLQYNKEALSMDITPDFYIIRSNRFPYFIKKIGPTKIINIGTKKNYKIDIKGDTVRIDLI